MLSASHLRRLIHPQGSGNTVGAEEPPRKKIKKSAKPPNAALEPLAAGSGVNADGAAKAMAKVKKPRRRKLSKKRMSGDRATAAAVSAGGKKKRSPEAGSDDQLLASKFRFLNEQLYTLSSSEAFAMFRDDPEAFNIYHAGYAAQRAKWSEDPLDWVASDACLLRLLPADGAGVVVDFGCGDARLAARLAGRCRRVHSLDLVALNEQVTPCDMAACPLPDACADAAVFCLSLMNSNTGDFLAEAARVLRLRGHLCVVEALSRLERVQRFVGLIERFGFECKARRQDKYLVYLLFRKTRRRARGEPQPEIRLKPCLYKLR